MFRSEFKPNLGSDSVCVNSLSPESSVYLCGECSLAFTSIIKCNEHVVQVSKRLNSFFGKIILDDNLIFFIRSFMKNSKLKKTRLGNFSISNLLSNTLIQDVRQTVHIGSDLV